MKNTTYPYVITHDYAGSSPVTVSRHRSEETANARLERRRKSFRRAYPSNFPIRAIFPLSVRATDSL